MIDRKKLQGRQRFLRKRAHLGKGIARHLEVPDVAHIQAVVYTDGSFRPPETRAGWAFVVLRGSLILHKDAGLTDHPALSRNIDGECEAVIRAARCCVAEGLVSALIHYDYEGLEKWYTGEWKAVAPVAKRYLEALRALDLVIQWKKVKGHSGDHWNDFVDKMAGRAVRGELV